jgi:hypothetical protein
MKPGDSVKCDSGDIGTLVASRPEADYHVVDVAGELRCVLDRECRPVAGSPSFPRAFRVLSVCMATGTAVVEWNDGTTERVPAVVLRGLQARFPWAGPRGV